MKLLVGLGNIGEEYEGTRHNVGFDLTALLADRHAADPVRLRFDGATREARFGGHKVLLLQPHTLMNRSGQSVRKAFDFYKIQTEDLLVACDDFHLPVGTYGSRQEAATADRRDWRTSSRSWAPTRCPDCGSASDPSPKDGTTADFVLGKFSADESELIKATLRRAADGAETWGGRRDRRGDEPVQRVTLMVVCFTTKPQRTRRKTGSARHGLLAEREATKPILPRS